MSGDKKSSFVDLENSSNALMDLGRQYEDYDSPLSAQQSCSLDVFDLAKFLRNDLADSFAEDLNEFSKLPMENLDFDGLNDSFVNVDFHFDELAGSSQPSQGEEPKSFSDENDIVGVKEEEWESDDFSYDIFEDKYPEITHLDGVLCDDDLLPLASLVLPTISTESSLRKMIRKHSLNVPHLSFTVSGSLDRPWLCPPEVCGSFSIVSFGGSQYGCNDGHQS